jgi:hypothetical protein
MPVGASPVIRPLRLVTGFLDKSVPAPGTLEFFPVFCLFDDFNPPSFALGTGSQFERQNFEQIEHQA